jgi:hypothetical protein
MLNLATLKKGREERKDSKERKHNCKKGTTGLKGTER